MQVASVSHTPKRAHGALDGTNGTSTIVSDTDDVSPQPPKKQVSSILFYDAF
jgi:hypothetical protein